MAISLTTDGAQRGHDFVSIIVIQAVFVEQEVVNTNEQYPFIIPLWRRLISLFKWMLRCISIFIVIVFCANAQFSSTKSNIFFPGNLMSSLFLQTPLVMVRDNNALREILRKPNTEASSLALCLIRRKKAIAHQPQDDYQRLMNNKSPRNKRR